MRWISTLLVLGLTTGCASLPRNEAATADPTPTLKIREGRRLWLFSTALDNVGDWVFGTDDRSDFEKEADQDQIDQANRAATDPDRFRNIRGR